MDPYKTAVERAFELARSGDYASFNEIKKRVRAEGYNEKLLVGPALIKQLRSLVRASRHPPTSSRATSAEPGEQPER